MANIPTASNGRNQRATRRPPTDFTGMRKQQLEAEHATELKEKERSIGMAAEAARLAGPEELDFEDALTHVERHVEEIEPNRVEVKSPTMSIRVNYPIEDMTFGREVYEVGDKKHPLGDAATEPWVGGLRTMTFHEGQVYSNVPREIGEYLDAKGYLWH